MTGVNAVNMFQECLSYTSATGNDPDSPPSFEIYGEGLTDFPLYDAAMRVTEITTCTGNDRGNLKGFWFRLGDPTDENSDFIDLPTMGKS